MPSFYTRKGDEGQTGLLGKTRVDKDDVIIEALGNLDELSSVLGLARSASRVEAVKNVLIHIQRTLFYLMSEIAATPDGVKKFKYIQPEHILWVEEQIACFENQIEIPSYFIVSGDTPAAASLDLARSVTRRAERALVRLVKHNKQFDPQILAYINRLSSLFFILELFEIKQAGLVPTPASKELSA